MFGSVFHTFFLEWVPKSEKDAHSQGQMVERTHSGVLSHDKMQTNFNKCRVRLENCGRGKWTFSFLIYWPLIQPNHPACHARCQLFIRSGTVILVRSTHTETKITHTHSSNNVTSTRSNLGFSILLKDTSTGLGRAGNQTATLRSLDVALKCVCVWWSNTCLSLEISLHLTLPYSKHDCHYYTTSPLGFG